MDSINLSANKNCRSCLNVLDQQIYSLTTKNIPIENIDEIHSDMVNLAEIYNDCTHLNYEQMLPQWEWICSDCFMKLIDFFKFRNMCNASYNKLKEIELMHVESAENNEIELKVEVVDIAHILHSHEKSIVDDFVDDSDGDVRSLEEKIEYEDAMPVERIVSRSRNCKKTEEFYDESSSDYDEFLDRIKTEVKHLE